MGWIISFIICKLLGHKMITQYEWKDHVTGERRQQLRCDRCDYIITDEFRSIGSYYYSAAFDGYFLYSIPLWIWRLFDFLKRRKK